MFILHCQLILSFVVLAEIVSAAVSNAASALLKRFWSLKSTTKTAVSGHRPLMKFESGYTVETVFDGSKLGIEPYSVEVTLSGELLLLDSVNSNLYRILLPLSRYRSSDLLAACILLPGAVISLPSPSPLPLLVPPSFAACSPRSRSVVAAAQPASVVAAALCLWSPAPPSSPHLSHCPLPSSSFPSSDRLCRGHTNPSLPSSFPPLLLPFPAATTTGPWRHHDCTTCLSPLPSSSPPHHCPFFPCLLRCFQHYSSPAPLQPRDQRCPRLLFSTSNDNNHSHCLLSFPFPRCHPSPACGSSAAVLGSYFVRRCQRTFSPLWILVPCTAAIYVPTRHCHPVPQLSLLLPSSSSLLASCCFLTHSHHFLATTPPLPSTPPPLAIVVASSAIAVAASLFHNHHNPAHLLHLQQRRHCTPVPLPSPFSPLAAVSITARTTLPASPSNACCPLLPLQPRRRWLPTPSPAATQQPTAVVPFLPSHAASRYNSIIAFAAATISLFPFNRSEQCCLHDAASLYDSNLSLSSVISTAPSSAADVPFLPLPSPTPSPETPLLPSSSGRS
ncbi:hypothetical protein BHE74_00026813 [Ensete ventricosum]|nr:hypothetical protein BHE74_00026813 [Ensete ventricosum]